MPKVKETVEETVEKSTLEHITNGFQREDLNELRDKINEIIDFVKG